VFKVTPTGTLTTLHSFAGYPTDGAYPQAGLVMTTNGTFYGTTSAGGANDDGTVFSITSGGTLTTLLSFDYTDGAAPYAALVQASNGNFYGTTTEGGASNACPHGCGTVFSITSGGALTTLLSFDLTDGAYPTAALVQATNGNFYGTTDGGGASDYGTVFSITSGGTLTTLHSFDSTDGQLPYGGLVQATNGSFYGTTYEGGTSNYGTIFSLAVGVGPFVETVPTSGKVEAAVRILGTNLTGATSVTFNGTAATFTVVSRSEITTTVPTGATTSNVSFRVLP
jgi:uncharacterized repeat protein (TIGR03803 family)